MNGFAIEIQSKKNLKQIGDKILINLIKNKIKAKYQTFGKYIFLETSEKLKEDILKYRLYRAELSTEKMNDIFKTIKKLIDDIEEPANFAVKVSRKGEHRFTSTDLARDLAAAAFERWPKINVNLNEPSLEINVQIINNRSMIYLRN